MSLVNDMLKDLERRGAPGFGGDARPTQDLASPPRRVRRGALVLAAGTALTLAGAGGAAALWLGGSERPATTLAEANAPPTSSDPPAGETQAPATTAPGDGTDRAQAAGAPSEAEPAASEPTRITGLQLEQDEAGTQVRVALSGPTDHRLALGDEQLTLHLLGARLDQAFGAASPVGPIETVRQAADEAGVELTFALEGPVRVTRSALDRGKGEARQLVVALTRVPEPPQPTPREAAATTPDETPPASPETPEAVETAEAPAAEPASPAAPTGQAKRPAKAQPSGDEGTVVRKRARTPSPAELAARAYREGARQLRAGRIRAAERALRGALDHDAGHSRARRTLAAVLVRRGRAAEAKTLLQAGLERAPGDSVVAQLYGRLLTEQGDHARAAAVLERARPAPPSAPRYHALLAAVYQRLERYEDAATAYERILEVQPEQGVWWMGLALALEGQQRPRAALAAYRRAARAGGLRPEVGRYVDERIDALAGRQG